MTAVRGTVIWMLSMCHTLCWVWLHFHSAIPCNTKTLYFVPMLQRPSEVSEATQHVRGHNLGCSSCILLLCPQSSRVSLFGVSLHYLHTTAGQIHLNSNSILRVYLSAFRRTLVLSFQNFFWIQIYREEAQKAKSKRIFQIIFAGNVNH